MRVPNITKRSGRFQTINFLYILIYREKYEIKGVLKHNSAMANIAPFQITSTPPENSITSPINPTALDRPYIIQRVKAKPFIAQGKALQDGRQLLNFTSFEGLNIAGSLRNSASPGLGTSNMCVS